LNADRIDVRSKSPNRNLISLTRYRTKKVWETKRRKKWKATAHTDTNAHYHTVASRFSLTDAVSETWVLTSSF